MVSSAYRRVLLMYAFQKAFREKINEDYVLRNTMLDWGFYEILAHYFHVIPTKYANPQHSHWPAYKYVRDTQNWTVIHILVEWF